MAEFSSARILRIFPALAAHVFFVILIIGPLVTNMPIREFLTHPDVLSQPFKVLSFYKTEMELPGTFENNNETLASATLWTLRYEVLAYIGTGIAFALGLMRKKWMVLAQFVIFAVAWFSAQSLGVFEALPATGKNLLRFGVCYTLVTAIMLAYFIFWAAYIKLPKLSMAVNRLCCAANHSYLYGVMEMD